MAPCESGRNCHDADGEGVMSEDEPGGVLRFKDCLKFALENEEIPDPPSTNFGDSRTVSL